MADDDDDILSDEDSSPVATAFGDDDDQTQVQTLVTREGLKKLKDELDILKTDRRQEVAERLKEAISYGDLSENSEYEEAKNEQAFVEGRIIELEQMIKSAKIITEKRAKATGKIVDIGSLVTICKKGEKHEVTYTIVGSTEADPFDNKISNESPIGLALIGKTKGETVEVKAPSGVFKYEVVKVL